MSSRWTILNDKQQKTMEIADEAYKNVTDMILGTELVRGDTETEYSKYIIIFKSYTVQSIW